MATFSEVVGPLQLEDRRFFREMAMVRLNNAAKQLAERSEDTRAGALNGFTQHRRNYLRELAGEVDAAIKLLDDIGWHDPRKRRTTEKGVQ